MGSPPPPRSSRRNGTLELKGPGLSLFVVSIALLVLAYITMILRIFVRIKIKAFGTDDWLMCSGLVFYTIACISTLLAALKGVGTHVERLSEAQMRDAAKWFMFFQLFYVASTVPIKSSICVALLRITLQRTYRILLYMVIVLSLFAALTTDIVVLAQCKPISATWDKRKGTCAPTSVITGVSYFISAVSILTDWTCAILPAFILWGVQLKWRVKASVGVVLALGVVASTATLVRLKFLPSYTIGEDYLYHIAPIGIWSITESGIGITAGSLATLRPIIKHIPFLSNFSSGDKSKTPVTPKLSHRLEVLKGSARRNVIPGVSTEIEGTRRNWEELSDGESQRYILKESTVVVTSEGGERGS
ncbi:uncharacterized protein BDR25DRAFT_371641 [Lindgomyces ingoldianus]|uniref:Uncharacterized protein n=1 Tax=Lindgomyces ingoldianus TaxID=673940 RepID=A0ACB6QRW7_9PLEO|nr:uncharacterized protein BDR25DRAFT_371641 [Lindgomyces ingoldianus]KAF2469635.1 hypothetical protein BDR25DRAFT_371641 [Lindgomyces ingoldianus]